MKTSELAKKVLSLPSKAIDGMCDWLLDQEQQLYYQFDVANHSEGIAYSIVCSFNILTEPILRKVAHPIRGYQPAAS